MNDELNSNVSFESSRGMAILSCFMDAVVFLLGASLPGVCFASGPVEYTTSILNRIAPGDVLVVMALAMMAMARGIKLKRSGAFYCIALLMSFFMAFYRGGWSVSVANDSGVAFAALLMSFLYWLLGFNISRWPYLMRIYLAGIAVGVLWEGVIVLHDYYLPMGRWFVDKNPSRVRGTFRGSGQLGIYGVSCAGIMLSVAVALFRRRTMKVFSVIMGLLSCFIVFASSRRSGLLALAIWAVLSICCLFFWIEKQHRWKLLLGLLVSLVGLVLLMGFDSQSYLVQRSFAFYRDLTDPNGFFCHQLRAAGKNISLWFPFGLGVGRGGAIADGREFHSAYLALLVEMGLFGFAMFSWLFIDAGLSWWRAWRAKGRYQVSCMLLCFLLSAVVYMGHNRVHRSRGFMLMLGLTSGASVSILAARRRKNSSCAKESRSE